MKRVLTIQDISCLGKCSLTIALPVLSAMGCETVILPTALLSTHTMFSGYTFKDLSDQIDPIKEHWIREGISFDAIYTGYLGSSEEIDKIRSLISSMRGKDTAVIVDPVMADNGSLYPGFDMEYVSKNAQLCKEADIIIPNITEASLMTGMEFKTSYNEEYIKSMLLRLNELGAKTSIVTGVSLEEGRTGAMGYERESDSFFSYQHHRVDVSYHGTGDLFSSTFTGALMRGSDWREAVRIAADYTEHTISQTMLDPAKPWYGVNFEETLPQLISAIV